MSKKQKQMALVIGGIILVILFFMMGRGKQGTAQQGAPQNVGVSIPEILVPGLNIPANRREGNIPRYSGGSAMLPDIDLTMPGYDVPVSSGNVTNFGEADAGTSFSFVVPAFNSPPRQPGQPTIVPTSVLGVPPTGSNGKPGGGCGCGSSRVTPIVMARATGESTRVEANKTPWWEKSMWGAFG